MEAPRLMCVMPLQVTISDGLTGETIRTVDIKADPLDMCVAERKEDGAKREVRRSSSTVCS